MKLRSIAVALLLAAGVSRAADYHFGADLSGVKPGVVFKDNGQEKPALQIFRDHGYNWVRYRLWHTPTQGAQNLEYVIQRAQEAKKFGFKFMLNFHYADSWADPTQQPVPKAWEGMDADKMANAVFEYTRDTIAAFKKAGVLPDMIQIGNEIGNGMLWPLGKVRDWKSKETYPQNWDNLARFLYAGVNGVDAGRGNAPRPKIMIHVDHGGDIPLTRWFFDKVRDKVRDYDIPYDTIGFSFYPWSHGTLPDLRATLDFAAAEYNKDVILVETGYQNRPGRYFKELPGPYPESPEGQRQWLEDVNHIVMDVPHGRGKGVYWWEPGNSGARGFFDSNGNTLPVMSVFDRFTRPAHRTDGQ